MGWSQAYEHAGRHGGVLLVREGPDFGLTVDQIRKRATRETWDRPYRGQVILPGAVNGHRRRVWAALRSVPGAVAVTGTTALWLHGLVDRAPTQVHLLAERDVRSVATTGGRRLLRTATLEDGHLTTVDGIPVVVAGRAIADVAHEHPRKRVRGWLIDGRQRGHFEMPDLLVMARVMAGTAGMPALRELCWELDAQRCDSMLADWLREVLTAAGIATAPGEEAVTAPSGVTIHLDVPLRDWQVAGEAEGFGAHAKRRQMNADVRRRNTLESIKSWEIVWVTWDMLQDDPDGVVELFRVAIGRAQPRR